MERREESLRSHKEITRSSKTWNQSFHPFFGSGYFLYAPVMKTFEKSASLFENDDLFQPFLFFGRVGKYFMSVSLLSFLTTVRIFPAQNPLQIGEVDYDFNRSGIGCFVHDFIIHSASLTPYTGISIERSPRSLISFCDSKDLYRNEKIPKKRALFFIS